MAEKRLTRRAAIRAKCLDCTCGSAYEVRLCPCDDCPLWRYRLGVEIKNPTLPNDSEDVNVSEGKDTAKI